MKRRGDLHKQNREVKKEPAGMHCAFCRADKAPYWAIERRKGILWVCTRCYAKEAK